MANTTTQFTIKINGKDELVELNQLINQNAQSVGELKDQQNQLNQAFEQVAIGTKEYDQLQSELRGVNTQLKVIDESVSDLTISEKFEGVGRIVGAVGGAFAFASVSVQAFGDENSRTAQELQKLETQISAIIQGQQALTGIIDAFGSKNKIVAATLNTLSKGFNAVNISAKGAGLAIRGAFIATGIGALVAGVSFLIANFNEIKEAGADIFKAWQPFFDGVRNFASLLTFGLINNAETAKIVNALDATSEQIIKITEKTNAAIELTNAKLQAGIITKTQALEENLNNTTTALEQSLTSQSKSFSDVITQIVKGYDKFKNAEGQTFLPFDIQLKVAAFNKLNKEIEKGGIAAENAAKEQAKLTKEILKTATEGDEVYGKSVLTLQQRNDILKQIGATETDINKKSIERISAENQQRQEQQQQRIAAANSQLKIQETNIQIQNVELEKRKQNNAIIKQAIDLLVKLGNTFATEDITKSGLFQQTFFNLQNILDILPQTSKELIQIRKELFDVLGDFPSATTPDLYIEEYENLYNVLNTLRQRELQDNEKAIKLIEKNAKDRITANNTVIANLTDPKAINELKAQNVLIRAEADKNKSALSSQIITIQESYQNLIDTLENNVINISINLDTKDFEKDIDLLNKFKNGLNLTESELGTLNNVFEDFNMIGIDASTTYEKLTQAQKDIIENSIIKRTIEYYNTIQDNLQNQIKSFPELQKAIDKYKKEIEALNNQLSINNKISEDRIKLLQQELALLIQAEEIRKQQAIVDNPQSTFKQRVDAVNKINTLELKTIDDKFKAETKGLKETDAAYQIAIINRNKAEEELGKKTQDTLSKLQFEKNKQILDTVSNSITALGDGLNTIFAANTEANDNAIAALQEGATIIQENITAIEEQITFIDGLINEKKSIIKDLEAQAAAATGAQRQEILAQLDAEAKATKELVKEKNKERKAQQKAQEELLANQKKQQALEKENQKIAKESARIQKILALAQAGVAVATAFTPDPASAVAPFGIGLAVRAIAALAFIATLYSTLKTFADGGFVGGKTKKRADGGYTGTSTLRPDETGERPMYHTVQLHEKEWVAPRWMTESPKYGSLINDLEKTRVRGFAEGGSISPMTTQSMNNEQSTALLVASLNRPMYVAVTDINEGQTKVKVLENRGKI